MVTDRIRHFLHASLEWGYTPLARWLARRGVRANHVSIAAASLQTLAAVPIAAGYLAWGGALYLAAATLDTLDGTLARVTGTVSATGAFLDSTLDRLAEGALFAAIAYYYAARGEPWHAALAVLVLAVSMLVSYLRARAEALGIPGSDGLATRGERVLAMSLGLIVGWLALALYVVGLAALYTAGQRYRVVARVLFERDAKPNP
jgi:CDP-diacylglycerol--glycerol-3-phosphate 3-phosphatidyltransferase